MNSFIINHAFGSTLRVIEGCRFRVWGFQRVQVPSADGFNGSVLGFSGYCGLYGYIQTVVRKLGAEAIAGGSVTSP